MSSLFGRLVGANHIEDATVAVLAEWFPDYLLEVERQSGLTVNSIARPRSVRVSADVEKMPEDQTPAIVVSSPGVADVPRANGARQYQAQFSLRLSCVVSANGLPQQDRSPRALRIARLYALALRACLVQQTDGTYLFRRDWTGERYDVLPSIDDRTICVATVDFRIEIPDVVTSDAGPIDPLVHPGDFPDQPSPEWPTATTTDIDVMKRDDE